MNILAPMNEPMFPIVLEWFRPPKRNTLYPLFLYRTRRAWNTKLEKACACVLSKKGLSHLVKL
jgi:hypothetical protein